MSQPSRMVGFIQTHSRFLDRATLVIGIGLVLYHLSYVPFHFQNIILLRNNHLLGCLLLVSLAEIKKNPNRWPIWAFIIAASLAPLIYVQLFYPAIELRNYMLNPLDLVLGSLLVVVVLLTGYLSIGYILPTLACLLIAYATLGQFVPGVFGIPHISFDRLISWLSLGFTGIYGSGLRASAQYIFLFVVFGVLLQEAGAVAVFLEIGKILARRFNGGIGQTAVISSGFIGMVTGSSMGNVVITGVYTIPAMKAAGYRPKIAGAIEPVASVGGQLYPPIMGAGAFLMASFTGISYLSIVVAAIIPAFMYFFSAAASVEFVSRREGIQTRKEPYSLQGLLPRIPLFVVPVVVIILILMQGLSPMYAGFGAVLTLIILSSIFKETRFSPSRLASSIANGASNAAMICVACAVIGPIIETMGFTGLGIKLPAMIEKWSGGNLVFASLICGAICIILGMEMPTMAAYIVVALMAAPVLVNMGVSLIQAHLFVFYWAILAGLTPPVAVGVIAGASIAGARYIETCWQAIKIGFIIYLVPFLFLFNPILLAEWSGQSVILIAMTLFTAFLGILPIAAASAGYYVTWLNPIERVVLLLSTVGIWGYVIDQDPLLLGVGVGLGLVVTLYQLRKAKMIRS